MKIQVGIISGTELITKKFEDRAKKPTGYF